ncbi:MAG TPA: hypothetical protein VJ726_12955 [Candidatus Limnocylindria bacterium]|nr:hypothetical protein [Candidatus Limnocylindria bacterium]
MPWVRFFAARQDLLDFLDFAFAEPGLQVLEVDSEFDRELRRFSEREALAALPALGLDAHGDGFALQFALWTPAVMKFPRVRRIDLKPGAVDGHTFRFTIESAGLIVLQCGGRHDGILTTSKLGWFTEAGARKRAADALQPDAVDWTEHRRLTSRLRYHLTERVAVARVPSRVILAEALQLHRAGVVLKDHARGPETFTVH